jgi:hypothetical protein
MRGDKISFHLAERLGPAYFTPLFITFAVFRLFHRGTKWDT